MSRIDDLIAEHCPYGVEMKVLADVFDMKAGKFISAAEIAAAQDPDHRFPCYGGNGLRGFVATSSHTGRHLLIGRQGALCGNVKRVDGRFFATEHAVVCATKIDINLDWAFHMVTTMNLNQHATKSAQPGLAVGTLERVTIPLPPLVVQNEIANILDSFSDLASQLEAALAAELAARRRQYQHYRDLLLSFAEVSSASEASERASKLRWTTLNEICTAVTSGGTPLSTRPDFYNGDIPWLRTQEVRFTDIYDTAVKITERGLEASSAKWIPANCVIVAISGATAGRSAINKIPLTTNQHCCNLAIDPAKANYRYVFHWVAKEYERLKALGQGARADLNGDIIRRYPIPLPTLAEQARVADILDRFDALVSDLSIGLPAELRARRQQYEYYRDRLLTFREAA